MVLGVMLVVVYSYPRCVVPCCSWVSVKLSVRKLRKDVLLDPS